MTRRQFIERVGLTLAAAAVANQVLDLTGPHAAFAAGTGPTLPVGKPIVVMIELAGGNDILNTIVPYNVPNVTGYYRSARPNLGLKTVNTTRPYGPPPKSVYSPAVLDLDGSWALHGNLPWLANRWWTNRDVAIVQGTGENVMHEMSHFASMVYRWAGAFGGPLMNTGWLGRYNDLANPAQTLGAISLSGLNQSLASVSSPAVAINDIATFDWSVQSLASRPQWLADLVGMGDPALSATLNKVAVAGRALAAANSAIAQVKGLTPPAGSGNGTLGGQLQQAATLISAGMPCQTYCATLGGWDLHTGAIYNQWYQLGQLDDALSKFFALIDASARAKDVFVVISSEFGRQVTENSGMGTDHGGASSTIVLGGGVKGGLYGAMPSLVPANRYYDALVPTVDFRSVYATVLNRLGGDKNLTEAALGRDESNTSFADLGLFTSGPPPTTTTTALGTTSTVSATTTPSTTTPTPSTTTPTPSTTTPTTTSTTMRPASSTTSTTLPMTTTTTRK